MVKGIDLNLLSDLLHTSIPTDIVVNLIKDITMNEIKDGFFLSRLSKLIPNLITLNQTTFVKGRFIVDNSLLAQELVRGYNRKHLSPRSVMKSDLHKAFNSINWGFIYVVLKAIGLPPIFISWIETCFMIASFSVSLNGSPIGYFRGARGVSYHPKCKRIGLTHLSFADDLLIFCNGTVDSIIGVKSVLDAFYEISGLKLNASQCDLFSADIPISTLEDLSLITGFKIGRLPIRYLGIPLVIRKIIENDCSSLIDAIKSRLHLWSGKTLSYTERLELVRAVLFSITNYWCRFFWKGADKPAAGARVSWKQICRPKTEGGLGLKDLKIWNKACMMSLIKNILAGEGSLWVAWLKSYMLCSNDFCIVSLRGWLPTKERLYRMGIAKDCNCLLCDASIETRNHLFLECSLPMHYGLQSSPSMVFDLDTPIGMIYSNGQLLPGRVNPSLLLS
ncbi:uncharacterized protein LOC120193611 [Hibiscus syriacus]|uniref:uncharacterized protein LOC120193611 n=1 Tax=Hibiscus syriacus TaxID=106335 RepID=UPI001921DF59|nr:uncharacterized protein LOC120193611 [Hibiscus syriacus]